MSLIAFFNIYDLCVISGEKVFKGVVRCKDTYAQSVVISMTLKREIRILG